MESRVTKSDEASLHEAFQTRLENRPGGQSRLHSAVAHVLKHAGSMVRARACLVAARVVGLAPEPSMDLAIAVEYFHTASLIFDDMPSMDDAEERRHAPCVHRVYGEGAGMERLRARFFARRRAWWRGPFCTRSGSRGRRWICGWRGL